MDNQWRLRYNLRNLMAFHNDTYQTIADGVGRSKSSVHGDLNGRLTNNGKIVEIGPEAIREYARYFGVSVDVLMNEDCSILGGDELNVKLYTVNCFLLRCLPCFPPKENIDIFKEAYKIHRGVFDTVLSIRSLEKEVVEDLSDETSLDDLEKACDLYMGLLDDAIAGRKSAANWLSAKFFLMISEKGIYELALPEQRRSSAIKNSIRTNPGLEDLAKEIATATEDTLVEIEKERMLSIWEFEKAFDKCIDRLMNPRDNHLCRDIAEYYMCLQFVYGLIDNDSSQQKNCEIGIAMMNRLADFGNKYAIKYRDGLKRLVRANKVDS